MVRALGVAVSLMLGAGLMLPLQARACGTECGCDHDKKGATTADTAKAASSTSATDSQTQKATAPGAAQETPRPASTPVQVKPTPHASILAPVDALVAAKCSCHGPSDCTCKKGECKCSKCAHHQRQMMESLKGNPDPLKLPALARQDASTGVRL